MMRRSSKYLIFEAGNHGWIVKDLGFWTWSLMWLKRCHNPMRKNPSPGKKCPIIDLAMWARKNYQSVPKTQFLCFEEEERGSFEMGFWGGLRGFRYGVREFYTFNLQSSLAFEEEERGLFEMGFWRGLRAF